jgi:TPR repeat protein
VYMKTTNTQLKNARCSQKIALSFLNSKPPNYPRAIRFLSLAHYQGSTVATYHLGVLYKTAPALFRNYHLAFTFLKIAAQAGHQKAYRLLGDLYAQGQGV